MTRGAEKLQRDDVIRMARSVWGEPVILPFDQLTRFAALVYAAGQREMRERAAQTAVARLMENGNIRRCELAIRSLPIEVRK